MPKLLRTVYKTIQKSDNAEKIEIKNCVGNLYYHYQFLEIMLSFENGVIYFIHSQLFEEEYLL